MRWYLVVYNNLTSKGLKLHGKGCKYLYPAKNRPDTTFRIAKKKEIETHEKCKVCVARLGL